LIPQAFSCEFSLRAASRALFCPIFQAGDRCGIPFDKVRRRPAVAKNRYFDGGNEHDRTTLGIDAIFQL
jgi:hypothetical protein